MDKVCEEFMSYPFLHLRSQVIGFVARDDLKMEKKIGCGSTLALNLFTYNIDAPIKSIKIEWGA